METKGQIQDNQNHQTLPMPEIDDLSFNNKITLLRKSRSYV
jgi:hypothetical protein